MRFAPLACLVFGSLLPSALFANGAEDPEANVNSRYTVETVIVSGDGWSTNLASDHDPKISSGLRSQIAALIGAKLNPSLLDDLAHRLRKEFQARAVTHRLQRGTAPDSVRVVFIVSQRPARFDVSVPKFLFASRGGWNGTIEGTATARNNAVTFGLVSDGDDLAERDTGFLARYQNTHLGTDRAHLSFQFETYHVLWNDSTREALSPGLPAAGETSGVYRTRENFEPVVVFLLARPLTLSVGASFQQFQPELAGAPAEAANAAITALEYQRHTEGEDHRQDFDASYNLRAATRALGSDFVYARQHWEIRYAFTHGKSILTDDVQGGFLTGRAPLFERYYAGNSLLLRGWDRFEIDPFGGNRIIHNSVDYRYGLFQVFYDTGAVWESGQAAVPRHSVGAGLRQGPFFLALAFPVREGHADPIFMVGMNY